MRNFVVVALIVVGVLLAFFLDFLEKRILN